MARRRSHRRNPSTRREDHSWAPYRADERPVRAFREHDTHSLALAYANTYEVGMSSLGFQRVYELVHDTPGWVAERFFSNGEGMPLSVEADRPLNEFGCVAFSVSFEEDYLNLLRMLDRSSVPLRRKDRNEWDPLVVMGGSCAAINPLPMAAFIDVFALGAGENVLGELLGSLAEEESREALLARLAEHEGFYVPAIHDPESEPDLPKLRKMELSMEQMRAPGHLPTTCIVTPRTEFADKFLIEMSRGCPEKCRYCWATFGMGKFRWHPTDYILESLERARPVTDQIGFLATAVGDHPEIGRILREALAMGFRSSVSSIRIPAVKPEVLEPLYESGARSITLAPETGSDRMRAAMNKPITNATLLDKVKMIWEHGFTQLKLYFILGLPDETWDDVEAILELGRACRDLMLERASETGVIGNVHLGCNLLIPKPYTAWQRVAMEEERSLKKKIAYVKKAASREPNISLSMMSPKQAIWQTYISRAGTDAADAIERAARGESIASILRDLDHMVHPEVFVEMPGSLRWHFLRMG